MRLLLAEDEQALSKALTAILERNNYSVDAAFDGQTALEYLETGIYDGVILDIMMPKKTASRCCGNCWPVSGQRPDPSRLSRTQYSSWETSP